MTTMRYPLLLLSSSVVTSIDSQADLERMLGHTTRMAERARYWESAVLVDQDLERYAISGLELGVGPGLLTWMKRTRSVLSWEARSAGQVDLTWVKEWAVKVLSENDVLDTDVRDRLVHAIR